MKIIIVAALLAITNAIQFIGLSTSTKTCNVDSDCGPLEYCHKTYNRGGICSIIVPGWNDSCMRTSYPV